MKKVKVKVPKAGVKGNAFTRDEMESSIRFITEDGRRFESADEARFHEWRTRKFVAIFDAMSFVSPTQSLTPREVVNLMLEADAELDKIYKTIGLNHAIVVEAPLNRENREKNVKQEKTVPEILNNLKDLSIPA